MGQCFEGLAKKKPAEVKPAGTRVVITGNGADGKSYIVSDKRVSEKTDPFTLLETWKSSPLGAGDGNKLLPTEGKGPSVKDSGCKVIQFQFDPKPAGTPP